MPDRTWSRPLVRSQPASSRFVWDRVAPVREGKAPDLQSKNIRIYPYYSKHSIGPIFLLQYLRVLLFSFQRCSFVVFTRIKCAPTAYYIECTIPNWVTGGRAERCACAASDCMACAVTGFTLRAEPTPTPRPTPARRAPPNTAFFGFRFRVWIASFFSDSGRLTCEWRRTSYELWRQLRRAIIIIT